ncbi:MULTISPECIES: hypothetical protein [unclassified Pseudomonas]|uniref:hypothetical protein n=1 Tax=unclassified Pseudomonas TaxID=196821 RepID=UPI0021BAAC6E|nr:MULTISPECIES: hypothetical protein [unclassified Pseudomonas]MCT8164755.1 hypothetical protein [Pseudomonas sp. HD6422]MCT8181291.1 hypothetical protein [Pseudomonas sp. HD6421]
MDRHESVVVGGSLVSFLPGLTVEQRNAVELAILFTERATEDEYAAGLVSDWYGYFRRRMQYLGWDALSPEQVHWPQPQRQAIVDKAVSMARRVGGEKHASSLSLSLSALLQSDQALSHLEQHSRERGLFQLLPCAPAKNGNVDMVIYHEAGDRQEFTSGFLTRVLQSTTVKAELVRFNIRLFQQEHQARVRRNVERVMVQEVLAVKI